MKHRLAILSNFGRNLCLLTLVLNFCSLTLACDHDDEPEPETPDQSIPSQSDDTESSDIPDNPWLEFDYTEPIQSGTEKLDEQLKILIIGGSFGVDITRKLSDLLQCNNIETVYIRQLYKGFANVTDHIEGLRDNKNIYEENYIMEHNKWRNVSPQPLGELLRSKKWDLIVMNEAGAKAANPDIQIYDINVLLGLIKNIIDYTPRFVWLEGWSYADNESVQNFHLFDNSEIKMFNALNSATYNYIRPSGEFWKIVPCATAIQNARNRGIDQTSKHLTRDGYHADLGFTRSLLSLTFFLKVILPFYNVSPQDIKINDWKEGNFPCNNENKTYIQECAVKAVTNPYQLTYK